MTGRRMKLPVLGASSQESGGTASVPEVGTRPDPKRLAEGWEHRFVATGERVEEMVALYRELGFEVAADPVRSEDPQGGCDVCFSGTVEYRLIYTRRRKALDPSNPAEGG